MKKVLRFFVLPGALIFFSCQMIVAQKFDRGIDRDNKVTFIPKGAWLAGGTASFKSYNFSDYKFLVVDDMLGKAYTLALSPYATYFFTDNLGAGLRFAYKRDMMDIDKLSINLAEDLGISISEYNNIRHSYIAFAIFRSYISIAGNTRFGFFNEVQLSAGGGQGKFVNGKGETAEGTYHNTLELGIGLTPGLTAFITNDFAVEVSIGLLGFNYKKINQISNQVYEGGYSKAGASLKIDLLAINLSLAYFF
jgi:hypothetical protein